MKRFVLFMVFIAGMLNAMAIDPKTLIDEAGKSYSKGEFEQAIEKYKALINVGYVSSELYFNLGNAYYKKHDIKSAILFYEKAKLLDPSDKDIDFNLEMARSLTVDKIEAMPELFFITWFKGVRSQFSSNGWAILSISTFLVGLALFLLYLLSGRLLFRKLGFWLGSAFIVIVSVSFTMGFLLRQSQTANNTAILFTPTVTVKSTPSDSGNSLFILHEGCKVYILGEMKDINKVDWCEIKITDGNRGWVKRADLEII